MTPAPIETVYNGYRFRSRLEARWAVFFDAVGLRYEYEKEGFTLPSGRKYLPDFWLPDLNPAGAWVEVKPGNGYRMNKYAPSYEMKRSRDELLASMGVDLNSKEVEFAGSNRVYVVYGSPSVPDVGKESYVILNASGTPLSPVAAPWFFCRCSACGRVGVGFVGQSWWMRCCIDGAFSAAVHYQMHFAHGDEVGVDVACLSGVGLDEDLVPAAINRARQARFEHGEAPEASALPEPRFLWLDAP